MAVEELTMALSKSEFEKLMHDLKRMAKVLKIVETETDHDKRQTLIGLLRDEAERLAEDVMDMKEQGNAIP